MASTIRNHRRSALVLAALGALGTAAVIGAGPALADNAIDVSAVGPVNVGIDYSCDADAGITAINVLVGAPDAEQPSATGTEAAPVCDGKKQTTVVTLAGINGADGTLKAGDKVQVRAALVDKAESVIEGQAKLVTLG
ncbi:hypothetical protein [Nocardia sp. NPDC005978]|uniref:hypothetical protein n=1 Tax=unclassified Nocardia TaxID=2637762 RepID=UPI0033AD27D0